MRIGFARHEDPDDDNDGLADVVALLEGLEPGDGDTEGDSVGDAVELTAGTDGTHGATDPPPDGDLFSLGEPDGVFGSRDALVILRRVAEVTDG